MLPQSEDRVTIKIRGRPRGKRARITFWRKHENECWKNLIAGIKIVAINPLRSVAPGRQASLRAALYEKISKRLKYKSPENRISFDRRARCYRNIEDQAADDNSFAELADASAYRGLLARKALNTFISSIHSNSIARPSQHLARTRARRYMGMFWGGELIGFFMLRGGDTGHACDVWL